ncbi:hypothetical protein [Pantoea conspicua]|uniref:hypothetical protein n=1 Tax=Pantoea conspicua TaxID=472705 RepID=UPI00117FF534|nr:hypothetical protein [Pantoea conspicua]
MEYSRRSFVLSAFTLAFISAYPRISYACGVSDVLDKMSPAVKKTLVLGAIALVIVEPVAFPVLIAVGAGVWTIAKVVDSEKVGSILCNQ